MHATVYRPKHGPVFRAHLPAWVGELEGDVDYREILKREVTDVPATVAEGSSIGEEVEGTAEEAEAMASDEDDSYVQDGTPIHSTAIGDVDPEQRAPTGTHGKQREATNGNQREEQRNELRKELREEQRTGFKELPSTTLKLKTKPLPIVVKSEPQSVIHKEDAHILTIPGQR